MSHCCDYFYWQARTGQLGVRHGDPGEMSLKITFTRDSSLQLVVRRRLKRFELSYLGTHVLRLLWIVVAFTIPRLFNRATKFVSIGATIKPRLIQDSDFDFGSLLIFIVIDAIRF